MGLTLGAYRIACCATCSHIDRMRATTVLILGSFFAGTVDAQAVARRNLGAIDGVVADTGLHPLADATVSILGTEIRVATGANGRFRITGVPAGDYTMLTRRIGFEATTARVQIAEAETLRVAFSLEPVVAHLSPVTVKAAGLSPKMAEFFARRELGEGQYLTQAEIDTRNSLEVRDLLRSFTGVSVGATEVFNTRGHVLRQCVYRLIVDGTFAFTRLDLLPPVKDVAGIEVYIGPATVPLQYRSADKTCGVILIWTKDGG